MTHEEKLASAKLTYGKPFAHERHVERVRPKSEWLKKQEMRSAALAIVRGRKGA